MKSEAQSSNKLGTFAGVFTPSILTILGIILFLRLGYVVGSAGLRDALLVILFASAISVLTSFSVAAIATNLKVKGGGDYYLISRTLGPEFGGAIGAVLFLAQAVSVAFYSIGFAEAFAALTGIAHPLAVHAIAAVAVLGLAAVAWMGADWVTRLQYAIMGLLVLALASFVWGGMGAWNISVLEANWKISGTATVTALPFWTVFAIFFPAVTGFTQGISMSGDLADPRRSIPLGTFTAVGLSTVVYLGCAVLLAGASPAGELAADYSIMKRLSAFGPLVDAGIFAATLSSALASLVGAPRILQALAADNIFPFLGTFAQGEGPGNNPRRAIVPTTVIALGIVSLGNLNAVASIVSMFFLVSYGLLNYATYFEARAASPSFRPTFRAYHRNLSLVGGVGCVAAMFAVDVLAGAIAVSVTLMIQRYLEQRNLSARWADSRRAHHLSMVRQHLLAAAAEPEHARNWRPQLLVFSDDAQRRARLLRFATWIEGGSAITTVVRILEGKGAAMIAQRDEAEAALAQELKQEKSNAFPLVVLAPELDSAIGAVVQAAGVGPAHANTVVVNWHQGGPAFFGRLMSSRYGENLRTVFHLGCNLLILDADAAEWESLHDVPENRRVIDVWWTDTSTGHLMLMIAHLMTRNDDWDRARVRVLQVAEEGRPEAEQAAALKALLDDMRIDARPVIVGRDTEHPLHASHDSHVVFLPVTLHGSRLYHQFGGDVSDSLADLPIVVMTMAAHDVALDVDAEDEGTQEETIEESIEEPEPE